MESMHPHSTSTYSFMAIMTPFYPHPISTIAPNCEANLTQGQKSGGSWFKASPGKKFVRPYLKKTHHKKKVGRVAQSIGPEFKP
jgi:hypothetical protein